MRGCTLVISAVMLVLPARYALADEDDDTESEADRADDEEEASTADAADDADDADDGGETATKPKKKRGKKRRPTPEPEAEAEATEPVAPGGARASYHHVPPRVVFAGELLGATPLDSGNRELFGAGGGAAAGAEVYVSPQLGVSAGGAFIALAAGEGMSSTTWLAGRVGPRVHLGPSLFGASTRNDAWIDAHVTYGASGGIRRPGFDVGAAVQWEVSPALRLGPMVRYQFGSDPRDVNAQLVTLGLAIGFGGRERTIVHVEGDADGDGVADASDQCPERAAGDAPDPDREGCPIPDADGDGVLDGDDVCPDDAIGSQPDPARKGCPFVDTDGDNIADVNDRCPEEAGEPNPFSPAKHGCPALARIVENKIEILQQIFFETDSATIKDESFPVLEAVAATIKGLDGARVRVEGHTDQQGTDEYNLDLSRRRARAVAQWLIQNGGVDAGLIETEGYGRSRPIVSGSKADLSQNRRVEFVILSRK